MAEPLYLYTTEHCELCDRALQLLLDEPGLAGIRLVTVDVAADDRLLERYGEAIPVLEWREATLSWPFDAGDLSAFLQT